MDTHRILCDLFQDPALDINEMGLSMVPAGDDDPYAPFVVRENSKLGIPFDIIPSLYSYVLSELLRQVKARPILSIDDEDEVMRLSKSALLINADLLVAWNVRKEILLRHDRALAGSSPSERTLVWVRERSFLDLLFTKHPKMQEAWYHRKFVVQQLMDNSGESPEHGVEHEFRICSRVCDVYPKNYMAWTHRQVVLQFLVKFNLIRHIVKELDFTRKWILGHLSDHAAVHYREKVVMALHNLHHNENLWAEEWVFSTEIITDYPGHETQWAHRRFLAHFSKQLHVPFCLEKEAALLQLLLSDPVRTASFQAQRRWALAYALYVATIFQQESSYPLFNFVCASLSPQQDPTTANLESICTLLVNI